MDRLAFAWNSLNRLSKPFQSSPPRRSSNEPFRTASSRYLVRKLRNAFTFSTLSLRFWFLREVDVGARLPFSTSIREIGNFIDDDRKC